MRIRTIKPAFWVNEKMAALPDFARLLAIGLLNYADDHGFFWANSKMVRGMIFPFEEDHEKVAKGLAQLASEGFVKLGKSTDGRDVGYVVNFKKHQRVDKPQASEIEPIATFQERSENIPELIDDESALYRKGREGKVKDIAPASPTLEKVERPRNPVMDALASVEFSDLSQVTPKAWGRIATALKEIRAVSPDVTPEEITARSRVYGKVMPLNSSITAMALAMNWGKCIAPANSLVRVGL